MSLEQKDQKQARENIDKEHDVYDPIKARKDLAQRYRDHYLEQDYYVGLYGYTPYGYPGVKKSE